MDIAQQIAEEHERHEKVIKELEAKRELDLDTEPDWWTEYVESTKEAGNTDFSHGIWDRMSDQSKLQAILFVARLRARFTQAAPADDLRLHNEQVRIINDQIEKLKILHQHVKESLEFLGCDTSVKNGYIPDSWTLREQCHWAKQKIEQLKSDVELLHKARFSPTSVHINPGDEPLTADAEQTIGEVAKQVHARFSPPPADVDSGKPTLHDLRDLGKWDTAGKSAVEFVRSLRDADDLPRDADTLAEKIMRRLQRPDNFAAVFIDDQWRKPKEAKVLIAALIREHDAKEATNG